MAFVTDCAHHISLHPVRILSIPLAAIYLLREPAQTFSASPMCRRRHQSLHQAMLIRSRPLLRAVPHLTSPRRRRERPSVCRSRRHTCILSLSRQHQPQLAPPQSLRRLSHHPSSQPHRPSKRTMPPCAEHACCRRLSSAVCETAMCDVPCLLCLLANGVREWHNLAPLRP